MYNHIFGPVPSRRLGMSLGVDLVPHKVCTFDCIYCECGPTTQLTRTRKEYVSIDSVKDELRYYLGSHPFPDYVTFSGAGEPTLNLRIHEVITFLKQDYRELPVAVLTNGSLLNEALVREALCDCDVVLPSLDAAIDSVFQQVNRPHPSLSIDMYIQGLIDFRKAYNGAIWLEVMIIPGYNDGIDNLLSIKEAIQRINPDKVQLNTLDRPGSIGYLPTADWQSLSQIVELWNLNNVEIIAAAPERKALIAYRNDVEQTIFETITRRPCTLDDLEKILGLHRNEINKYLSVLSSEKKLKTVRQARGLFYLVQS